MNDVELKACLMPKVEALEEHNGTFLTFDETKEAIRLGIIEANDADFYCTEWKTPVDTMAIEISIEADEDDFPDIYQEIYDFISDILFSRYNIESFDVSQKEGSVENQSQ